MKELDSLKARLDLLYPENYSLSVTQEKTTDTSTITLKMNTHGN